MGYERYLNNQV